jgi:ABC-type amino acid transport substrate-binding protein
MWQQLLCLVLSSCSQPDTTVLHGSTAHVTSFLAAPYLIRRAGPPDPVTSATVDGAYEGFVVDLLDALGRTLGSRFVIREVADNRYGMPKVAAEGHTKEDWTGMIGEVMRGEADLAVADLTATAGRSLVVDFTQPILDNRLVAVAHRQVAVRSLAELVALDDVVFHVVQGGSTSKFFQMTVDDVYKEMAAKTRLVVVVKITKRS